MLLRVLRIKGLLSFDSEGLAVPLRELNVLIGPNGSGKSNFIEMLAMLKSSPNGLSTQVREAGGVHELFWKGLVLGASGSFEAVVQDGDRGDIRHGVAIMEDDRQLRVVSEQIVAEGRDTVLSHIYSQSPARMDVYGADGKSRPLQRQFFKTTESILSQLSDPQSYPVLARLQKGYREIRLFRNWQFGPQAVPRQTTPIDSPNDFLAEDCSNLDLVLSTFRGAPKKRFIQELAELFQGIDEYSTPTGQNGIMLYLEEAGGRSIPKTRLSDGTLRYLCLLSILLHPSPPPLVAIEEPELGMHPDLLPNLGRLIKEASKRMQLVITTHSQILLDSFSQDPEDVIVCSKFAGASNFERLSKAQLDTWLKDHTLGELWNLGQIGGTRW